MQDVSSTPAGHEVHEVEKKYQKKTPNISYRATNFFKALFTPFGKLDSRVKTGVMIAQGFLILLLLQIFHSDILPTPMEVLKSFFGLVTNPNYLYNDSDFIGNLITTFGTVFYAMGISIVITMVIVYLSKIPFFSFFAWIISICRYLPLAALIPVITLAISGGNVSELKNSLLIYGIVPFFTVSFLGATQLRQQEIDKSFLNRNNAWETLWEVVIVGKLDQLFVVMKQNFAIAWAMISMVEGLAMSEGGIGTMIVKAGKYLHLDVMLAILLAILLSGMLFDFIWGFIRKLLFKYIKEK